MEMNEIKIIAKSFIIDEFSEVMEKKVNSKNKTLEDREKIIEYVVKTKAWNDATIYERYNINSALFKNKDKNSIKDSIINYLTNRIDDLGSDDCNYNDWINDVIRYLISNYKMTFGVAQKLVNMSIKYLYFLELGYDYRLFDDKLLSDYQDEFDVPIDSYILKWTLLNSLFDEILKENVNKLSVWNKINNKDVYQLLQERAKYLLKETFPQYPILIAESEVWSLIKPMKKYL